MRKIVALVVAFALFAFAMCVMAVDKSPPNKTGAVVAKSMNTAPALEQTFSIESRRPPLRIELKAVEYQPLVAVEQRRGFLFIDYPMLA